MTLATYVNYALPVIVLLIGAGTLILNTALRKSKKSPAKFVEAPPETAPPPRVRTEAVVNLSAFRKAS